MTQPRHNLRPPWVWFGERPSKTDGLSYPAPSRSPNKSEPLVRFIGGTSDVHSFRIPGHCTDASHHPALALEDGRLCRPKPGHRINLSNQIPPSWQNLEHAAKILELDVVAPLSQLQEVAKKAVEIHGKSMLWLLDSLGRTRRLRLLRSCIGGSLICVGSPQETFEQFDTNLFGGLNASWASLSYVRPRNTGTAVRTGSLTDCGWIKVGAGTRPSIQ